MILTEETLLKEIRDGAEIFIRTASDECDNAVFETYKFTYEELHAFLLCFGSGLVRQLNEHNKALKWSSDWLVNSANANGNPDVIEFANKISMTLKSQIRND